MTALQHKLEALYKQRDINESMDLNDYSLQDDINKTREQIALEKYKQKEARR
jgi:hypothetical protein